MKSAAAGMLVSLLLPGCEEHRVDAGYWETERERIELGQQLKLVEYKAGQAGSGSHAELKLLQNTLRELDGRTQALLRKRSALGAEIKEIEHRNDDLVRVAIQNRRTNALGRKFDSFSLNDGRTFQNVSITGIDDGGVAIRHEHGAARLRYADLSPEQCGLFGLEEGAALAAEDRERREAIAYERQIDEEMEVLRGREELGAAVVKRDDQARINRSLAAHESISARTRPLAQPATTVGAGSWRGYSRYRSYRPAYRYVYYYPACPATPNPFYSRRAYRNPGDDKGRGPCPE